MNKTKLTYEEANQLILTVPWKTKLCIQGESCWCRMIVAEDEIVDEEDNNVHIAGPGSVTKEHAEHIVKVHNESLRARGEDYLQPELNKYKNIGVEHDKE